MASSDDSLVCLEMGDSYQIMNNATMGLVLASIVQPLGSAVLNAAVSYQTMVWVEPLTPRWTASFTNECHVLQVIIKMHWL